MSSELGSAQLGAFDLGGLDSSGSNLFPGAATLAYTGGTPVVAQSGGTSLSPGGASLVYTGGTPSINVISLSPGAATFTYTGGTPNISPLDLFPGGATYTYSAGTPVVTLTIFVAPSVSLLTYVVGTPGVTLVQTGGSGRQAIINGTSYLWNDESPATITKTLSSAWSATFSVFYASGPVPVCGNEVALFWDSAKVFGGFVLSVTNTAIPGRTDRSWLTITCTGYQGYCDRAIVAKLYTLFLGGVGRIMIYNIWYEHLFQFGITDADEQGPGVPIAEQLFWYITVTECFNRIRDQNPGWDWYISDNKELIWLDNTSGPSAPFTVTDANKNTNAESISVIVSNGKFRNKQWVLPSTNVAGLHSDESTAISGQQAFLTEYTLTTKPLVFLDTGGGPVQQNVDTLGEPFTAAPCYYIPDGGEVFFKVGLTAGDVVDIQYPNPFPLGFSAQNDASIAAIGLYETVYQAKNVTDEATATALAGGLLAMYGTAGAFQIELDLGYNSATQSAWLSPGMRLTVDITFPTADDVFTVESVTSTLDSLKVWRHSVVARVDPGEVSPTFEQSFLASGRIVVGNAPAPSTWEIGTDIPGLTNPGISVGAVANTWTCPPIQGGGGITIASANGFFRLNPPTGDSFILDWLLNGTSIFPTGDANKLVIPDGSTDIISTFSFVSANIVVVEGDVITANVIQVGSSFAGSNFTGHINFVR